MTTISDGTLEHIAFFRFSRENPKMNIYIYIYNIYILYIYYIFKKTKKMEPNLQDLNFSYINKNISSF